MTQIREYRREIPARAKWGNGAWQDEADKVQWIDEATGLDCLINRGPLGAWCGYVGVPEGHPAFAKEYDAVDVDVHGGLTFADFCQEPTREMWQRWCERMNASESEAAKHPNGDAARGLRDLGHLRYDFDAWRAWGESAFICHVPFNGRPARVWWLGFDCAHSGDLTPGMNEFRDRLRFDNDFETYRDRRYVEQETVRLAAQLAASHV